MDRSDGYFNNIYHSRTNRSTMIIDNINHPADINNDNNNTNYGINLE